MLGADGKGRFYWHLSTAMTRHATLGEAAGSCQGPPRSPPLPPPPLPPSRPNQRLSWSGGRAEFLARRGNAQALPETRVLATWFRYDLSCRRGLDYIENAWFAHIAFRFPGFALLAFLGCVLGSVMTRHVAAAEYYGNPAAIIEVEYLNVAAPHNIRVVIYSSALRGFL